MRGGVAFSFFVIGSYKPNASGLGWRVAGYDAVRERRAYFTRSWVERQTLFVKHIIPSHTRSLPFGGLLCFYYLARWCDVYDTVRFVKPIGFLDPAELARRGDWKRQSITSLASGEVQDKFFLNTEGEGTLPRLTWLAGSGYLVAEVSLPKLLNGENVTLIHEGDLPGAFKRVSEFVGDATGMAAVDVADWNLSRVDYCFAWKVDSLLPLYLEALSKLHLSRHNRQSIEGDTLTFHSKANKLQFYDKHKESGLDIAEGVLRLEVTIRNTHYLAEKWLKTERTADKLLTDEGSKKVLEYFLDRLGLSSDKPICSRAGLLARIVKEFGIAGAEKLWLFVQLYELYGSKLVAADFYNGRTFYRRRKQLAEAGLLTWHDKADVLLPALEVKTDKLLGV